jgi:RNA polymerase sigma factor (sigma-70 family)
MLPGPRKLTIVSGKLLSVSVFIFASTSIGPGESECDSWALFFYNHSSQGSAQGTGTDVQIIFASQKVKAMAADHSTDRLTNIPTRWEDVRLAQTGTAQEAQDARDALFRRYGGAVRRYLLATVRNSDIAEDLTQEFALTLLEGKIQRANPRYGRFRDYIKGMLFHLVSRHRRRQKRQLAQRADLEQTEPFSNESDQLFDQSWRDELLARTWAVLAEAHSSYFTVLHFRAAHPDMPVEEMIAELSPQLGKALSAENIRQLLHRARKVFADLLLREVAQSLTHATPEAVEQELNDLQLGVYFRDRSCASA